MEQISLKKAGIINAISRYSVIIINILLNAVLARILSPSDYGIVAVTTVFVTLFSIFANMGIGTAIIQNRDLNDDDINCLFTLTVYIGIILTILFNLLSIPMSFFYNDNTYYSICPILSISLFFSTVNMVPNAVLMKNKRFISVGIRTVFTAVISGIVAVILAYIGFKYYSLVIQSVISSLALFIWNYWIVKPKFVKRIKRDSINKVKRFSAFQFAFEIINYFSRNADNLLTSKFIGVEQLGYYDKAYKLMLYPVNNLTHVITPVLHPILAEYQDDKKYIYEKYLKVIKLLSLLGVFIASFCFVSSKEIILIMFGEQWLPSVSCFTLMSLGIWAQMLLATTGSIFQSLGKTDLLFKTGCVTTALTLLGIVLGLIEGNVEAISRNVAISYNIQFCFSYYMLICKGFNYKFLNFLRNFICDLAIFIVTLLSGLVFNYFIQIDNYVLSAIIKISVIGLAYLIMLILCKQLHYFTDFLRRKK